MATSAAKSIPRGELKPYILYCLSTRGKTKASAGLRVRLARSSFLSSPRGHNDKKEIDNLFSELSLFSGNKYDGNTLRVAFSPEEKLDDNTLIKIIDQIGEDYFQGRPVFSVVHDDTHHTHIHFFSTFLDPNGKVGLTFKGKGKYREAIRRQEVIDRACSAAGLSVLSREEGKYCRSSNRTPLAAVRAAEAGKYIWTSDLKKRIAAAKKQSMDIPSFLSNLAKQGIEGRIRGQGISYSFHDANGKKRIARGSRLGIRFTLAEIEKTINFGKAEQERRTTMGQFQNSWRRAVSNVLEGENIEEALARELKKDGYTLKFSGDEVTFDGPDIACRESRKEIMDSLSQEFKERKKVLRQTQKAYARAYVRRAAILASEGKTPEQIRDLLSFKLTEKERLEQVQRERAHLFLVMSADELKKKEQKLRAEGMLIPAAAMQKILDAPDIAKSFAAGNVMPLIRSVVSLSLSSLQARPLKRSIIEDAKKMKFEKALRQNQNTGETEPVKSVTPYFLPVVGPRR